MTDLEITRLCAEAMGTPMQLVEPQFLWPTGVMLAPAKGEFLVSYDPLNNDAQAFALVKKFDLAVWGHAHAAGNWKYHVECNYTGGREDTLGLGHGDTHNRAICECVAKMMLANKQP